MPETFRNNYVLAWGFGGVFSPALVLGASVGGILTYFGTIFGISELGNSLILAGMAALSASVIGAPIASIVIIFDNSFI